MEIWRNKWNLIVICDTFVKNSKFVKSQQKGVRKVQT